MSGHDVDARKVVWSGAAIVATIAVVVAAVFLLLRFWQIPPGADRAGLPYRLVIDAPALQSAPQPDLAAYRAEKARILSTAGWVDAQHGIVRIPIASAMQLLVEQQHVVGAAPAPAPIAAVTDVTAPLLPASAATSGAAR